MIVFKEALEILCLSAQSRLILCDLLDCCLPGSSVHGDSPGRNIGVKNLKRILEEIHFLLQGIFLIQGLNLHSPVSPALQADYLHWGHRGKPRDPADALKFHRAFSENTLGERIGHRGWHWNRWVLPSTGAHHHLQFILPSVAQSNQEVGWGKKLAPSQDLWGWWSKAFHTSNAYSHLHLPRLIHHRKCFHLESGDKTCSKIYAH